MPSATGQFYSSVSGDQNISAMTTDAVNLRDGSSGDTATGYTIVHTNGATLAAYWDLGSAQNVDQAKVTAAYAGGGTSGSIKIYSSPDGTTWTLQSTVTSGMTGSLAQYSGSFTAVSARYWKAVSQALGSGSVTIDVTDYRLYLSGAEYTIGSTSTKTQTGKTRITAKTTQTQTGKTRITAVTSQTQTGKTRITATVSKTQAGVTRITNVTTQTIPGVTRIQLTDTKTQTGVTRISRLDTQTQTGKTRITATTPQTQAGVTRITAKTTRTISGVAYIASIIDQGIATSAMVPGGTLVPAVVPLSSRAIVSGAIVPGGSLALNINSLGIPSSVATGSSSLFFDSIITTIPGIATRSSIPGGTLKPGVVFLSSIGLSAPDTVPGGSLGGGRAVITGFGIPSSANVPRGTIGVDRDACAGPLLPLPPSVAQISSAQLAAQSGLDQSLFDSFFDGIPTARLKANADAIAKALALEPSAVKARLAFLERQYVGRTATPAGAMYAGLTQR